MKKHNLTGVAFSRIALVDKGASFDTKTGDGAHVLLFKRATPADAEENTMTIEQLLKAVEALTPEQKDTLKKALGAAVAPEDILKGLTPAQRELVEKAQADAKAAKDEAAANKSAIEKLTKAARQVDLRKRVDVYASLSGDMEALASILGVVEDTMGADTAKKFEETLKAWNAQVEKSGVLNKAIGSRGTTESATPGSALEEVEKLAEEIVTKSAGKVSKTEAYAQVFSAHPELYERHSTETAGRGSADKK